MIKNKKKRKTMRKFKVIQTYKVQDIWENVEAKDEQEAIDICMGGRFIDETKDLENTTETKVEEIK
jgi:hypothetical protein